MLTVLTYDDVATTAAFVGGLFLVVAAAIVGVAYWSRRGAPRHLRIEDLPERWRR